MHEEIDVLTIIVRDFLNITFQKRKTSRTKKMANIADINNIMYKSKLLDIYKDLNLIKIIHFYHIWIIYKNWPPLLLQLILNKFQNLNGIQTMFFWP